MIRITKNTSKVSSLKWFTKAEVDTGYQGNDIDSFVIIPGVTNYNHIYTMGQWLCFDSDNSYIGVQFTSESDLERYFVQLIREIKLNQITNVNVDIDTKSK
jgi:hypothetical protein